MDDLIAVEDKNQTPRCSLSVWVISPPQLSLSARKRSPSGAELAVDVAARGWPAIAIAIAIAGVALLALIGAYVLLRWL
jgi:hypothetical protein